MPALPNETPTAVLIDRWVRNHDEAAFASLVERYAGMVFSTAMRASGGRRDLANDVSQQVFVSLAQKAPALARDERLGGWLHKRASWTASKMMRSENRRHNREQAKAMSEPSISEPIEEAPWEEWTPQLDAALQRLKKADRDAIVLRYLEGRDLRSVGEALGSSEEAARKRVARSLEKLRGLLGGRGFTLSAGALLTALSQQPASAAPSAAAVAQWSSASIASAKTTGAAALLYRWLTPAMSCGLGATLALVATPLLKGKAESVSDTAKSSSGDVAIQNPAGNSITTAAPPPPGEPRFDWEEFISEFKATLDLPQSYVRGVQLRNLFNLAPEMHRLELGRAMLAEIDPIKIDLDLAQAFSYYLGRQSPPEERMLFFIDDWPTQRGRDFGLTKAFEDWIKVDPQSAIAWASQIRRENGFGKFSYAGRALSETILKTLISELKKTDGIEAARALQIDWVNSGDADFRLSGYDLKTEADYRSAWEFIGKIDAPGVRRTARSNLLNRMGGNFPDMAREIVESTTDGRQRARLVENYAVRQIGDPRLQPAERRQTAEWCLQQTPERAREKQFGTIASWWLYGDQADEAIAWIGSHPELHTEGVLKQIGDSIRQGNISSPGGGGKPRLDAAELRALSDITERVHDLWKNTDAVAAQRFLEENQAWLEKRGHQKGAVK